MTGLEIDSRRIEPGRPVRRDPWRRRARRRRTRPGSGGRARARTTPHAAMAALGRAVRDRSSARVVGITGSTGKTSTKDILAALCRPHLRTVAAEQSHNNEIGLPLTLTRIADDTEVVIAEIGTRGAGQVAALCEIARPDIGVITPNRPRTPRAVRDDRGGCSRRGRDRRRAAGRRGWSSFRPARRCSSRHLDRAGCRGRHATATSGHVRLLGFEADERAHLDVDAFDERLSLTFNFRSRHNATNALAALGAYAALGLPLAEAQRGADQVSLSRWREEERPLPGGGVLINDCYNANPVSMARRSTISPSGRAGGGVSPFSATWPSSARMRPPTTARSARAAGRRRRRPARCTRAARPRLPRGCRGGRRAPLGARRSSWASRCSRALLRPGDCVLVKGSRSMGLEVVADVLAAA